MLEVYVGSMVGRCHTLDPVNGSESLKLLARRRKKDDGETNACCRGLATSVVPVLSSRCFEYSVHELLCPGTPSFPPEPEPGQHH